MLPNSENICSVDMFSTQTKFLVSCFAPATENKQNRAAMSDLWSAVRTLAKYGRIHVNNGHAIARCDNTLPVLAPRGEFRY